MLTLLPLLCLPWLASESRAEDFASCSAEIEALRGVWSDGGTFVPLYKDLRLAAYLTRLLPPAVARRPSSAPAAVLPVYAAESLAFARDNRVYISTRLLLQFVREEELVQSLAATTRAARPLRGSRKSRSASPCAFLPLPAAGFDDLWTELARNVRLYEEWTTPRLKTRSRPGVVGSGVAR